MIIGLSGGIATGKSEASKIFKKLGCYIIDADKISKQLTSKGSDVLKKIVESFGTDILTKTGSLNRRKLGQLIFSNKGAKLQLERILHVSIIKKINEIVAKKYKDVDIVIDAPLLFEVGLDRICDKVIVIYAKYSLQLKRFMKRDKLQKQEAEQRIAVQMPIEEKMMLATVVIDNSFTLKELNKNIKHIYLQLKSR
ncbi:MAG: dephospho-CoA kinase [Endomicrobiaceae bacterium]|nr:dephospho-CoA kinase [Endomicrobiaceae bacterium]